MRFTRSAPATILVALATAACSSASDGGVRITISATQPELVQGETAQVVVTVLNTGERPITVQGNTCNGHFRVRDVSGAVVGPIPAPCFAVSIPLTLGPSESRDLSGFWNAIAPSGGNGAALPSTYLHPGLYRLRAQLFVHPTAGETRSVNEVTIRLRAP